MAALLFMAITACNSPASKDESAMGADKSAQETNKEAMRQIFKAFETGDASQIDNYIAPNAVEHTPDPNITSEGSQRVKDAIAMYHTAFPQSKVEIMNITAEGDMVTAQFRWTGTNSGPMGSMPATNKTMDITGVDIVRFENGKGVEHWGYWEEGKMMAQLGMAPPPQNMAEGDHSKMNEMQEKK